MKNLLSNVVIGRRFEIMQLIGFTPEDINNPVKYEVKIVSQRKLESYLNGGWQIRRKHYPFITSLMDWWAKFYANNQIHISWNFVNKLIAIATLIVGILTLLK